MDIFQQLYQFILSIINALKKLVAEIRSRNDG